MDPFYVINFYRSEMHYIFISVNDTFCESTSSSCLDSFINSPLFCEKSKVIFL